MLKGLLFWRYWISLGSTLLPNFIQAKGEWFRRLMQISHICYQEERSTVDPIASFELHGCAGFRLCHEMQWHIYWWTGFLRVISGNPDRSSLDFLSMCAWQKNGRAVKIWPLQLSRCLKRVCIYIYFYMHTHMCIFKPLQNQEWEAMKSLGMHLFTSLFSKIAERLQNGIACFISAPCPC